MNRAETTIKKQYKKRIVLIKKQYKKGIGVIKKHYKERIAVIKKHYKKRIVVEATIKKNILTVTKKQFKKRKSH